MSNRLFNILTLLILVGVALAAYVHNRSLLPPLLTASQIEESRQFLLQCHYLENNWPAAHDYLSVTTDFTVNVSASNRLCGVYDPEKVEITLFRPAWVERGCMGPSPKLVLAHEMLHQAGLPPHTRYATPQLYLQLDPIEIVMRFCTIEALDNNIPLQWSN